MILVGDCLDRMKELPDRSVQGRFLPGNRYSPGTEFKKGQHWRKPRMHFHKDWLLEKYLTMSAPEIAAEIGCVPQTIHYWLKKHGIQSRSTAETRKLKHWGSLGSANPMFGKTGKLNPGYVDGSSPERQRLYVRGVGRAFVRSVLGRDGHKCRKCGVVRTGPRSMHVHHIKPWAGNVDLRFDTENAVSLCRSCHQWVHSKCNISREFLA